jgi:hypothetical protein
MNNSDRELIDKYVAKHGVTKCPDLEAGSEREQLERQDKQIARTMSRAGRKGWIKRASQGRIGRM